MILKCFFQPLLRTTLLLTLILIGFNHSLHAKSGDLDATFGSNGTGVAYDTNVLPTSLGGAETSLSYPNNLVSLSDGRFIVGGGFLDKYSQHLDAPETNDAQFLLARFNSQGLLDSIFGQNGIVKFSFGPGHDWLKVLTVQPDGKIIAAGRINRFPWPEEITAMWKDLTPEEAINKASSLPPMGMVRFNSNGTLDTSFGTNGQVVSMLNGTPSAIVVQPDGKILLGVNVGGSVQYSMVVLRYLTDGTPDISFGLDQSGLVSISMGMYYCALSNTENQVNVPAGINTLSMQPDGKIVIAGSYFDTSLYNNYSQSKGQYTAVAVRLLDNGVPDPDFGLGGKVTYNPDFEVTDTAHIMQPDGKMVIAMMEWKDDKLKKDGDDVKLDLIRLQPDGSLDNTYGQNGVAETLIQATDYSHMALQADGKVAVETVYDLARFTANGSLDTTFGDGGKVKLWDETSEDWYQSDYGSVYNGLFMQAQAVALQPAGDIAVVSGGSVKLLNPVAGVDSCSAFGDAHPDLHKQGIVCAWGDKKAISEQSDKKPLFFGQRFGVGITRYLGTDCTQTKWYPDTDQDGFGDSKNPGIGCTATGKAPSGMVTNHLDCDDTNSSIHPGTYELCSDGKDNNCNGFVDEQKNWHKDTDNDGYGDSATPGTTTCSPPPNTVSNNKDCNDSDSQINALLTYYPDTDGDGYGVEDGKSSKACQIPPVGYSPWPGDCDDNDKAIHPNATEQCNGIDDDCNQQSDDNISQQSCQTGKSGICAVGSLVCQNGKASCAILSQPEAEKCDGSDNDCDGLVDDDDPDTEDILKTDYYLDQDGDGYGPPVSFKRFCKKPDASQGNYVTQGGDCNDTNPNIHPGMAETKCDNKDDNCSGVIDEGLEKTKVCIDSDQDDWCQSGTQLLVCPQMIPEGYSAAKNINTVIMDPLVPGGIGSDCNDTNASISPDAPDQTCDGVDNNCNKVADEGFVSSICNTDKQGICQAGSLLCQQGTTTCAQTNQPQVESCNNLDDDCNGKVDDIDPSNKTNGVSSYYPDKDGDTFGDNSNNITPIVSCTKPTNPQFSYVPNNSDCDDTNKNINPDMEEICNDKDDNCNGQADEGVLVLTFFQDQDGDGFGNSNVLKTKCNLPAGYVSDDKDCNDTDKSINPGTSESCNGKDDNCNKQIDEGKLDGNACDSGEPSTCGPGTDVCTSGALKCVSNTDPFGEICDGIDNDCDAKIDDADDSVTGQTNYYLDSDKDGFGDPNQPKKGCSKPDGYVLDKDCNDADPNINPDMEEICGNGKDDNCYAGDNC